MYCDFEGTTNCDLEDCNVHRMKLSKTDDALALILAFLLWLPMLFIWLLAIGIDKVIELVKS